jgi:putative FmdB family regulatory protein
MIRAYDYACEDCHNEFEIWGTVAEHSKGLIKACPLCGSEKIEEKLSFQVSKRSGSGGSSCCGPGSGSGCCG